MIKSAAEDAIKSLEAVPEQTLEHFKEAAEKLLAEKDAVTAVAAALACVSGHMKIEERSLLNSSTVSYSSPSSLLIVVKL